MNTMADDKKRSPFDQSQSDDQQKGGEATATDQDLSQDLTDLPEDTDVADLEDDTTVGEDMGTQSESDDEETPSK